MPEPTERHCNGALTRHERAPDDDLRCGRPEIEPDDKVDWLSTTRP
jgi:hypothetical protein